MLGKLAKYFFLIGLLSSGIPILIGTHNEWFVTIMIFSTLCISFGLLCFLGWLIGGPITVVVKEDHSNR